ncbi:DUF368 domain-containing protein [Chitinispirillales bacterium ANBcel5]|uniref:DUF368 domain-containing protein n=1 Tax=Cellulosispirillum alkaliphilum TaxID=3039283 RepID=UPI002A595E2D|nr:DUF368 domain-containing protein [Chitinispirillales bacterium ANBcel5]
MLLWVKHLGCGFLIGAANVVPGVSGGSLLLLLGLYQRVMSALSELKGNFFHKTIRHSSGLLFSSQRKKHFDSLLELFKGIDGIFLCQIAIGAALSILLLSDLIDYLLDNQFTNTYAFFFGLILVSIFYSLRFLKKRRAYHLIPMLIGAILTIYISSAVNPADSVILKSEHYKSIYETQITDDSDTPEPTSTNFASSYTLTDLLFSSISGAVSLSAMILPGVSGSLVLILMGQYGEVISAVSGLRTFEIDSFIFLTFFALGMIFGTLLFARVINWVLKRFYNGTIALLIGLMAGSLHALWPFKRVVVMDQYIRTPEGISLLNNISVYTNINTLPSGGSEFLQALLLCLSGISIMILLSYYGRKKTVQFQ